MKYTLVNAYCKKNIGDDLFISILVDQYPDRNFIIIGQKENLGFLQEKSNVIIENIYRLSTLEKLFLKLKFRKYDDLKKSKWSVFLEKYKDKIDSYLILGGSMFIEEKQHNFDTTNLIFEKLKGAKKAVVGSNFGPYKTESFYQFYKKNFSDFHSVIFRDSYSKNLFKESSSVSSLTDFVFNYKFDQVKKLANSVGISVINLSHRESIKKYNQDYLSFLRSIIVKSQKENKNCFLFSFCSAEGDADIINQLCAEFPNVKPVYYDGNIKAFIDIYSSMETIVATRFHSLVLSLLFQQKVLSVIYSEKTFNLISDIDKDIVFVRLSELNDFDVNHINDLKIIEIEDVKKNAAKYFDKLDAILK